MYVRIVSLLVTLLLIVQSTGPILAGQPLEPLADIEAVSSAGSPDTSDLPEGGGVKCRGSDYDGQLGVNPGWAPVDVVGFGPAALCPDVIGLPGVDVLDLQAVALHWNEARTADNQQYDINLDGRIDAADLQITAGHWGDICSSPAGTDYPSTSIYVSPQGSDDNDGSSREQAFASVKQALESAQAGDVILVLEGVYTEGIELEGLIGPIVILGEGDVVLDGERNIRMGIWCEYCSNITFDNLTFRNYTDVGIGVYLSDQVVMRHLTVHNNGFAVQLVSWEFEGYGIMVDESSDVLVEYNVAYENGPNPQIFPDFLMGTGINIYGCTHCQMMYNQVYSNIGGSLVEDSVDVLVEGNEIWGNDLDASVDEWWDSGLWIDGGHDVTARNNIFYDNLGPGIEVSNEDNQDVYG